MPLIMQVDEVDIHNVNSPLGLMTFLTALGHVSSSGWSSPELAPRFYIAPPADGIWDFDFIADAPTGMVMPVTLPVSAVRLIEAPKWFKGVRVHAQNGSLEAAQTKRMLGLTPAAPQLVLAPAAAAIVTKDLAIYDDSFQPTGRTKFDPWPHVEMKKLRHHLTLTVTGPDENKIRSCLNQAAAAGLIAAIAAAYATGGLGLSAAISAFLASLTSCLGNGFEAKIDDRSHWIYWWT